MADIQVFTKDLSEGRLISWTELRQLVPLSRTTVWRRVRDGSFPAPLQISPGRVAWSLISVTTWMASQKSVG